MARLANAFKGQFYPAPEQAVSKILEYLQPPSDGSGFHMLDPCAGKGAAIKQLAEGLNCRQSDVWAIELSDFRSEIVADTLPEANILAPCSFFACSITSKAFGLVYCNPPFADEAGQGRLEHKFLEKAIGLLAPKGVLVYVIPQATMENYATRQLLLTWFDDLAVLPFPSNCRKFKEVVVFCRKLKTHEAAFQRDWNHAVKYFDPARAAGATYEIPGTLGPNRFLKTALTEEEVLAALASSPLRKHLEPPEPLPIAEPPLPLGKGHRAMLLAAAQLDGIIRPPGEPPHIVRGTAKKEQYMVSQHVDHEEKTTKTVYSEKIALTVRVLSVSGKIKTLVQN